VAYNSLRKKIWSQAMIRSDKMEMYFALVGIVFISFGAGYLLAEFNEFRRQIKKYSED
jgi:hypothetical protein